MEIIISKRRLTVVDRYSTSYNKTTKSWSCDCPHGSINSVKLDMFPCKHIKNAKKLTKKIIPAHLED